MSEVRAAATCRIVRERTGAPLGGSADAAVLAAFRTAPGRPGATDVEAARYA